MSTQKKPLAILIIGGIFCGAVLLYVSRQRTIAFIGALLGQTPAATDQAANAPATPASARYQVVEQVQAATLKKKWLPLATSETLADGTVKRTAGFEFVSFASPSALTVKTMDGATEKFKVTKSATIHTVDSYTLDAAGQIVGLSYGETTGLPALAKVAQGDPIRLTYLQKNLKPENTSTASVAAVLIFPIHP